MSKYKRKHGGKRVKKFGSPSLALADQSRKEGFWSKETGFQSRETVFRSQETSFRSHEKDFCTCALGIVVVVVVVVVQPCPTKTYFWDRNLFPGTKNPFHGT